METSAPTPATASQPAPWITFPGTLAPEDVIETVDRMLGSLDAAGASDLHLEPRSDGAIARLRKSGVFLEPVRLTQGTAARIVARLKVMAQLSVHRTDLPQEGSLPLPGGRGNGRLSLVPTIHGEKAVLRLHRRGDESRGLEQLGFDAAMISTWQRQLAAPQGLLLVTGPSGAGKTTTLYASAERIARTQGHLRSLASLEDPVERAVDWMAQTPVAPDRGLDFASGLRALLRQDPEVLMVGEIRDSETAGIAIQAALTGHLVLSSMHTSSASEALARLFDLGVDPGLVAAALRGVVSQRLLPRLCENADPRCPRCLGTGLEGRHAVGELLLIAGSVREQVRQGVHSEALEVLARSQGFVPIMDKVQRMIEAGVTRSEWVEGVLEGVAS